MSIWRTVLSWEAGFQGSRVRLLGSEPKEYRNKHGQVVTIEPGAMGVLTTDVNPYWCRVLWDDYKDAGRTWTPRNDFEIVGG
jgi:hypothetical protein